MSTADDRLESAQLIRASASGIADRSDLSRIRKLRFSEAGFDRAVWREMCALGWLGLRLPEADGGSGLGAFEWCALAEELGAALVPEPLITAGLAARMLPSDARDAVLAGTRVILAAWQESRRALFEPAQTTCRDGRLCGRKLFVPLAGGADAFVVVAREGAFLVRADAPGLRLTITATQDGGHFGTLDFEGTPTDPARGDWGAALDDAVLATAAYLLGIIEAVLERTLDYLNTRRQFGVPIGNFQVLQHRCVDLKLHAALTRASVGEAAALIDAGTDPKTRAAAVSRAKARASEATLLVSRQAIQLHGGIGYTDEHDIGLYLRKAMALAPSFGDAAVHRARWGKTALDTDETPAAQIQPGSRESLKITA